MRAVGISVLFIFMCTCVFSQKDSLRKKKLNFLFGKDSNLVFSGTKVVEKMDTSENPKLTISGYLSAYIAHYDDEITKGEFVQFPTICPRNDQFGLNMAMISMEYRSRNLRSNLVFHYGDIPASSWPAEFNLIQEAHAGFRIYKNLWLDAGFFKTHIGLESFQPRENVTSSMAILTFYEPYYLSGAKLTYELSSKFLVQLNAFNGYNEYIDNNKNKALGFSAVYNPIENLSITYNFLTCDETPDNQPVKHQRYYNNLYATLKMRKLDVGIEMNYGLQDRTLISDPTKQASMKSGLIVVEYNINPKFSIYAREEYFSDPNKILSFDNNIGNYIYGTTGGIEIKPYKNIALSLESRMLHSDNLIFKQGSFYTNQRLEFIACMDVWF
jgi:hypothetical protein